MPPSMAHIRQSRPDSGRVNMAPVRQSRHDFGLEYLIYIIVAKSGGDAVPGIFDATHRPRGAGSGFVNPKPQTLDPKP